MMKIYFKQIYFKQNGDKTMRIMQTIPLKDINIQEEKNSRDLINTTNILDLANNISTNGLLMPIIVRPALTPEQSDNGKYKYQLVAGFRRSLAHRYLRIENINAIIDDNIQSEEDFVRTNLIENINRRDLTLAEEAKAVQYYLKNNYPMTMIASVLAQPLSWVEVRSKYLALPKDVQEVIVEFKLTNAQIGNLYRLRDSKSDMYELIRSYKSNKQKASAFDKDAHELRKLRQKQRGIKALTQKKQVTSKEALMDLAFELDEILGLNIASFALFYAAGELSLFEFHSRVKDLVPGYIIPADINLSLAS